MLDERLNLFLISLLLAGACATPRNSLAHHPAATQPSTGSGGGETEAPAERASSTSMPTEESTDAGDGATPPGPKPTPGHDPLETPDDVSGVPSDAIVSASGLAWRVLRRGDGHVSPRRWDSVMAHYSGWTTDGKLFDSSYQYGRPARVPVSQVIPGWVEALQGMVVGEKRRLWIPAALAYKDRPGPQGMLVFDLELLEIIPGPEPLPPPDDLLAPPEDATTTRSGLTYKIIRSGTGPRPRAHDAVEVHYSGWTADGTMFDSSRPRGRTTTFSLDRVIPGWTEGLQKMREGAAARLWIPAALAYENRSGRPQGTLVFDVELVRVERRPQPPKAPRNVARPPRRAARTASGLRHLRLRKGSGRAHPSSESTVLVHYAGWTTDGKLFDNSYSRGEPARFSLTRVIPGWREGVQLMVAGEKRRFWIPGHLAYDGRPGRPQGTLVFDVELIEIVDVEVEEAGRKTSPDSDTTLGVGDTDID